MKKMPLWLDEATTLLWSQVGVQWYRDPQEVILAQDPTVIIRDSVIVKDGDPATMTGNGCYEVLQYSMKGQNSIADQKKSHLKTLESPPGFQFDSSHPDRPSKLNNYLQ